MRVEEERWEIKRRKMFRFRIRTDNGDQRWRLRRGERDGLEIKIIFLKE